MWLSLLLNNHSQLVFSEHLELLRDKCGPVRMRWVREDGRVERFHERFVLGRVSGGVPGMRDAEDLEVVLESVSYQDLVFQEFCNFRLGLVESDRVVARQILLGNARDERSVIRHLFDNLHVGVVDGDSVPVDDRNTRETRLEAAGSDAHHFGVQGNVLRLLLFGQLGGRNADNLGSRRFRFFGTLATRRGGGLFGCFLYYRRGGGLVGG
mmetsp:Transcript_9235/g.13927  ORF Transcript_9235/g.13927 Transcript_9235/m.13927 type:complete len:210 (-) Transcript_9235:404-1033(-)